MPDAHTRLNASSAKRWMSCPPSVRLEERLPDSGSEYAAEGTLAHSLTETILHYNNNEINKKTFSTRFGEIKADPMYNREVQDYIEDYTQRIWGTINEVKATCPDARVLFEQRLDVSEYVPDGSGTGDVIIVADGAVNTIDPKYDKDAGVSARNSLQLRLYGLGAYLEYSMLHDIRRIQMIIIQSRLENIFVGELTVKELLDWAEREVRPKAAQAYAGEGEFKVGGHCWFCKAKVTYRVHAKYNLELTKLGFVDPTLLTDEETGEVLKRADELDHWVKDVIGFALAEALRGTKYEGWKLMEGTSRRRYTDQDVITMRLTTEGWGEDEIYKPQELIGITEMTKLTGKEKFEELLSDLVIKSEGKPTLVPGSDKRPELNRVTEAKQDFDNKVGK